MFLSFLHCNFCGKSPSPGDKFYAVSCCHIVCDDCRISKRIDLSCSLCNRSVTLNEIRPDMVKGKEYFTDQVEVLQKFIDKIESHVNDAEDTDQILSKGTVSFFDSKTLDDYANGAEDSSFDPEIEITQITKKAEKSVKLASKTIKDINVLTGQLENMLQKSQEPRTLDLRWSTPITRPFF